MLKETMPQIEKQDDLQLISDLILFFVCMTIALHDGNNPKQNVSVILTDGLAC